MSRPGQVRRGTLLVDQDADGDGLPDGAAYRALITELRGKDGDGDGYGIGGNHFTHTARRNIDMTYIVMNNQIYGLTTGQISPTSCDGMKTKSTPFGSVEAPINPITSAIMNGANEAAVKAFLDGRIRFGRIVELVESALQTVEATEAVDLAMVFDADRRARAFVSSRGCAVAPKSRRTTTRCSRK